MATQFPVSTKHKPSPHSHFWLSSADRVPRFGTEEKSQALDLLVSYLCSSHCPQHLTELLRVLWSHRSTVVTSGYTPTTPHSCSLLIHPGIHPHCVFEESAVRMLNACCRLILYDVGVCLGFLTDLLSCSKQPSASRFRDDSQTHT